MATTEQLIESPKENSKEIGIGKPIAFDGDRNRIKTFIQECNVYFDINDKVYTTDKTKIAFMLSLMNDKEARIWKGHYINAITGKNLKITYPPFTDFIEALERAFIPADEEGEAMNKLELLRQGNRPVEQMVTDFRMLITQAGLAEETTSDHKHLIKIFMNCLNPQLKKKILFGESVPKTIHSWYAKAIQYDSTYRMGQALMKMNENTKKTQGVPWKRNNMADPNAMDTTVGTATTSGTAFIGALTEEMRAALMKIGACFRCRKTGHLSRDCPQKNQGYQAPQQQPPQKHTAKGIHSNIRTMTVEERKELMALLTEDADF